LRGEQKSKLFFYPETPPIFAFLVKSSYKSAPQQISIFFCTAARPAL